MSTIVTNRKVNSAVEVRNCSSNLHFHLFLLQLHWSVSSKLGCYLVFGNELTYPLHSRISSPMGWGQDCELFSNQTSRKTRPSTMVAQHITFSALCLTQSSYWYGFMTLQYLKFRRLGWWRRTNHFSSVKMIFWGSMFPMFLCICCIFML